MIAYRPESSNVDADVLSRYPDNKEITEISIDSAKLMCGCVVTPPLYTAKSIDSLEASDVPCQPMEQVKRRETRYRTAE